MDFVPPYTPEMKAALDDYWAAQNHAEEHWAYVRLLRLGFPPAYGEDEAQVERLKHCPDCPPWDVPMSERGFGI